MARKHSIAKSIMGIDMAIVRRKACVRGEDIEAVANEEILERVRKAHPGREVTMEYRRVGRFIYVGKRLAYETEPHTEHYGRINFWPRG